MSEKTAYLCRFFFFFILCFAIFGLLNGCESGANEYRFWCWVLIRCWLFLCWIFWGIEFGRVGEWIGMIRWVDWDDWEGGWGDAGRAGGRCAYARAYARSRTRSFVFLLSQVSQRMGLRILHYFKNDVWFCWKRRVVLWKVTCRFMENNVLFWDLRLKSRVENGVLGSFLGGVAVWKCDIFWVLFPLLM